VPANGVRRNQIAEEFSNVSKTVRFVSMDGGVICLESLFKGFLPIAIEITESLAHETVESRESAFLGTTFDDHVH